MAQRLKCLPSMQETWVQSLGQEDPLEKEMATHSRILAWRIPWTEEPGGLQSIGLQRVGYKWATSLSLHFHVLKRSKCLLISWLQSPSAVILETKKIKSVTVSIVSPSICHEVMGPRQRQGQRHYFANKGPSSQSCGFSSSHIWMWELDYKESWALKNWCFWTMGLEKTLESPLDCKEIQPVHPKWDQSWIFTGRTDVEAETPILWPPDVKSWLIWKDPDSGKDWRQEEKGMKEDDMVEWHYRLNGHEFE